MKTIRYTLFSIILALTIWSCKTDMPDMAYQQEDYPLSTTDSLINREYDIITLEQEDDYEGPVVATLMHKPTTDSTSRKAVLYLHGYGDYYFQYHEGEFFREQGYHFYALELRKYGRSLLPHQRPNYARDLREYFADIDAAIEYIRQQGQETILLNGHSTGGLTGSLYAAQGEQREQIDGLILNSPFFTFRSSGAEKAGINLFASLGRFYKNAYVPMESEGVYGRSIHQDYQGEWDYNFTWKPLAGFPLYYAWLRAIRRGHRQVKRGLELDIPVLVLRSDKSWREETFAPEAMQADAVLDVTSMQARAENLGTQVDIRVIENGMHDVFLSEKSVREEAFRQAADWLQQEFGQ